MRGETYAGSPRQSMIGTTARWAALPRMGSRVLTVERTGPLMAFPSGVLPPRSSGPTQRPAVDPAGRWFSAWPSYGAA